MEGLLVVKVSLGWALADEQVVPRGRERGACCGWREPYEERGNVTKKGAKGESVGKTAKAGRGGPSGLAES